MAAIPQYLELVKQKLMANDDKAADSWANTLDSIVCNGASDLIRLTVGAKFYPYTKSTAGNEIVALESRISKQVKFLLDVGADVYRTKRIAVPIKYDTFVDAVLHLSHLEIVKMLIEYGADWSVKTTSGNFGPIKHAFKLDEKGAVNLILDDDVDVKYLESYCLFHCAIVALSGTALEEAVESLVKLGADVNSRAGDARFWGYSAFLFAVKSNNAKVVEFLINNGADVNSIYVGSSVLEFAIKEGAIDAVKVLLNHGARERSGRRKYPLNIAIEQDNLEMVKLFLDNGACIDGPEINEKTPIDLAVEKGHGKIVEFLLDRGAARDNSTLAYAICCARVNVIELLLKRGYDYNGVYLSDKMLSIAVRHGEVETVKLLLDYGACINGVSENGKYPLLYAIEISGRDRVVQLLLERGADINLEFRGKTAVMEAALRANDKVCMFLVRHLIMMKSLNLQVSESNLNAMITWEKLNSLQIKCTDEMELLKIEEFDDSNVFYYDLLITKDLDKLAALARNENIVKTAKSHDFEQRYPIYGELIVENLNKGFLRNKDYSLITRFFSYLSDRDHDQLPKLPLTVVCKTFSYLSFDNIVGLRNL